MKPLTRIIGILLTLLVVACGHPEKADNTLFTGTVENYKLEVAFKVAANWVFPADDTSNQEDEAYIVLTIDRDGYLKDIAIVREPRSKSLKKSILSAIKRSEPFPPFPENFYQDQIEVGIKASPKRLD